MSTIVSVLALFAFTSLALWSIRDLGRPAEQNPVENDWVAVRARHAAEAEIEAIDREARGTP